VLEWGVEYLRLLTAQITLEISDRVTRKESFDELLSLSVHIAEFYTREHLFFEAVDILYETNKLEHLLDFTSAEN